MSIQTMARAVLVANAGVQALVKTGTVTRVYPMGEAPQPMVLPTITYTGAGKFTDYTEDGPALVRARLQVDAWAATYAEATAVAKAIRDAFHAYGGTPDGIQRFKALNEVDLSEDVQETSGTLRLHRISADFYAWARNPAA